MPPRRTRFVAALLAAAALIIVLPGAAFALDEDRGLPFSIDAGAVEIDQKTGRAVYRGNVVLEQGSMRLEADRVEVQVDQRRRITSVTATGKPVRLRALLESRDEELLANAERIVYRAETREVELSGKAWVRRGADEFRAHRLVYGLDDKRLSADGTDNQDGRVHAIFHPEIKNDKP